jgi:hypothetical protein
LITASNGSQSPIEVDQGDWKEKLGSPELMAGYLRTALRYWYSKEWFGSEKRKQEA